MLRQRLLVLRRVLMRMIPPRLESTRLSLSLVETPGTYYVIVDGRDVGGLPTFRLDLTSTSAAADLGTSDLCDASTPELPFNPDGVTSFAVSLDRATVTPV